MSPEQPFFVDSASTARSGADAAANFARMLDGKFKVLTVLETDIDSFTLEVLRVSDERPVVLRLLKPAAAAHKVIANRFKNEANRLQLLVHHNVPHCSGIEVTESGQPYAILDYFQGRSLRQILREESSLRLARAVNIVVQVCAALTAAHRLGIAEHNLSPRNIYLLKVNDGVEVVKMPGLGFVETPPATGDTFIHKIQNLAHSDAIVYKSPEACLGGDLDERSSIYSLGCLLYELVTGSVPILGQTALETGNKHLSETALLLEDVRPDLCFPGPLQDIVSKALKKEPSERYLKITEMQHALRALEVVDMPVVWVRPRRERRYPKSIQPGHVSGRWNLISSVRSGVQTDSIAGSVENQIIWAFGLGFSGVLAVFGAGNFLWLLPLLVAIIIRLVMATMSVLNSSRLTPYKQKEEMTLPEKRLTKE